MQGQNYYVVESSQLKEVRQLAPRRIMHTWAEVYYENKWLALEGVIIDDRYIRAIKKKFSTIKGRFIGYGIGTKNLEHLNVE